MEENDIRIEDNDMVRESEGEVALSGLKKLASMAVENRPSSVNPLKGVEENEEQERKNLHTPNSSSKAKVLVVENSNNDQEQGDGINGVELERLENLSKETTRKLNILWTEMGLDKQERTRQLTSLVEAVEQVFVQKVKDECALRDQLIETAENLEDENNKLSQQLDEKRVKDSEDKPDKGKNLMLNLTWLRSELAHLQSIKDERLQNVSQICEKIKTIWDELGLEEDIELLQLENFLTPDNMREYQTTLNNLQHQRTKRIAIIQQHINDIIKLFEELVVEPESEFDHAILAGGEVLGINENVLSSLIQRASELTNEKIQRTEQLRLLGTKIQPLWEKLLINADERSQFFMQNRGLGKDVITKCENELQRLLDLKAENMGNLIENQKEELIALWDELQYTEEQREPFTQSFMLGTIDEATLEAFEQEVEVMSLQADYSRPILKAVNRLNELRIEREEIAEASKDPSRLLSRAKGNTLLEQSKKADRVKKFIPKVMEKIKTLIKQYESEHGEFLLNGTRYVEDMEQFEVAYNEKILEERRLKKLGKAGVENSNHSNISRSNNGIMRKANKSKMNSDLNRSFASYASSNTNY